MAGRETTSRLAAIRAAVISLLKFAFIGGVIYFAVLLIIGALTKVWDAISGVNPTLAVALITASATIIAATVTVTLGRYLERKREIEAHFRAEKVKIYDEFLRELFKLFHEEDKNDSKELVGFLRDWQRRLIIWGGRSVLRAYINWLDNLKTGHFTAKTIYLMDEFLRALRSDIGQRSVGLERGFFGALMLRHGSLFLAEAKRNPSITLTELAEIEKQRFGDQKSGT